MGGVDEGKEVKKTTQVLSVSEWIIESTVQYSVPLYIYTVAV